jgi:hypothetical protein
MSPRSSGDAVAHDRRVLGVAAERDAPATSPAARVHSRSNASCTRLDSGVCEAITIAECQPSDDGEERAWRASCSMESEIE